jgi:hypothetical protein
MHLVGDAAALALRHEADVAERGDAGHDRKQVAHFVVAKADHFHGPAHRLVVRLVVDGADFGHAALRQVHIVLWGARHQPARTRLVKDVEVALALGLVHLPKRQSVYESLCV